MKQNLLYRDVDALQAPGRALPGEREAINHVKKRKLTNKGVEVVFDAKAHK